MRKSLLKKIRDRKLGFKDFRRLVKKLAALMAKDAESKIKKDSNVIIVPILRSGLALLDPFLKKFESAKIGCIGMKRDEKSLKPFLYYESLPKIKRQNIVVILDPMIATGGSLTLAIKTIIKKGGSISNIIAFGVIASKIGIKNVKKRYNIDIHVEAIDEKLNSKGVITPGLGDFGDRFFCKV